MVDDDPGLQKLITTLLVRAGMEPIQATNANDAAQILRDGPAPDVILLDMMLPDISGMEFLRRVRAKKQFEDIRNFLGFSKEVSTEIIDKKLKHF